MILVAETDSRRVILRREKDSPT